MTQALATQNGAAIIEAVIAKGDLAQLEPEQRISYYRQVCNSLGLNELTRPFEYIVLQGKMTLYPRKDCTDQLRKIHGVNITKLEREYLEDLYAVTAYASDKSGRTDSAIGAVSIKGLSGDGLANALMKAETKAKRRVTLSLCGLGLVDESEVESIPNASPVVVDSATGEIVEPQSVPEMVTSADSRIWKRWLALKAEAESLGIRVSELRLPIDKAELAERGQRVFEGVEQRKQQLANEDADRAEGKAKHDQDSAADGPPASAVPQGRGDQAQPAGSPRRPQKNEDAMF